MPGTNDDGGRAHVSTGFSSYGYFTSTRTFVGFVIMS
jgi:hypothetical protein